MNKECGFNILECLLVLVLIAIVTLIGIHRYRSYQRNIQMANIKNDIASIQYALNRYYQKIGCNTKGVFPNDRRRPNLTVLGLKLPGRPPQIPLKNAYQVNVFDTHEKTQDGKPIYALRVSAHFSSRYSKERLKWYQRMLGAAQVIGDRLIWVSLPGSMASKTDAKFWVLRSQAEQFRRIENKALQKEMGNTAQTSASFCAR